MPGRASVGAVTAYFIAHLAIHDEQEYQRYLDAADEVFSRHGGRYLAVDDAPEVLEGSGEYARIVLIEFPDREALRRWYFSPEYQQILAHRLRAADSDAVAIERRR